MPLCIASIVEGHGEVDALPVLVRRIAFELDPAIDLEFPSPIRISRSKILRPGELERAVSLAALNAGRDGGIFVLLDSDDACPASLGPELLQRVRATRPDIPSSVVLAKAEYEAWFLAAAASLRGLRGFPHDLESPPGPESIRGAKEWLSKRMLNRNYAETIDQAALTARFDTALARRAESFDKCYRDLTAMLSLLRGRQS
jgi:hypothetical protein